MFDEFRWSAEQSNTRSKVMIYPKRLQSIVMGASCCMLAFFAQAQTIKIHQSLGLTGPVADYAAAKQAGSKLLFDEVNAGGGIGGRKIEMVFVDDGYKGDLAAKNLALAAKDASVIAMLGPLGVPVVDGLIDAAEQNGLPIVGMSSGSDKSRARIGKFMFPMRATYGDEARATIKQLQVIGHKAFTVIYQDDPFGKSIRDSYVSALQTAGLRAVFETPLARGSELTAQQIQQLDAHKQTVTLLALTTQSAAIALKQMRNAGNYSQAYGMSVLGGVALIQQAGALAAGTAISQIVPNLKSTALPIVRAYMKACQSAKAEPSQYAFEAYLEAKILSEAMKRASAQNRSFGRPELIKALHSMQPYDMGGYSVFYAPDKHVGSKFVDLTIVTKQGSLIH
jgi:branched-chain amino acid transport system substrate-binding protein